MPTKQKPPSLATMRSMLWSISAMLREGNIRKAQNEARRLYDALYSMGLLPELSE